LITIFIDLIEAIANNQLLLTILIAAQYSILIDWARQARGELIGELNFLQHLYSKQEVGLINMLTSCLNCLEVVTTARSF